MSEKLLQIQTGSDDAPAERVLKFTDAVYADWKRLADSTDELIGLTTGIDSVDLVTTGIRPGETWAIGGRTGEVLDEGKRIPGERCEHDLAIYRPMDEYGRPTGEDEIVIAKQRSGPVSNEKVRFDSKTMTFFERN